MPAEHTRRTFFSFASAAAVAATQSDALVAANDKVNVAIIGLGGRGRNHLDIYAKLPDANIAALCDVNQAALERGQATVEKATGKEAQRLRGHAPGLRRQERRRRVHAAPNHWHALATIWACQAGKDVLHRKARLPQRFRRPADDRGRAQIPTHGADRLAAPQHAAQDQGHAASCTRASSARSTWPRDCASSGALRSATSRTSPTPAGSRLGQVPGPRAHASLQRAALQVQLALVLGHRQRRHRQPGHSRDGHRRWGLGKPRPARNAWSRPAASTSYDDDQETPNTQIATFDYGDAEIDVRSPRRRHRS